MQPFAASVVPPSATASSPQAVVPAQVCRAAIPAVGLIAASRAGIHRDHLGHQVRPGDRGNSALRLEVVVAQRSAQHLVAVLAEVEALRSVLHLAQNLAAVQVESQVLRLVQLMAEVAGARGWWRTWRLAARKIAVQWKFSPLY